MLKTLHFIRSVLKIGHRTYIQLRIGVIGFCVFPLLLVERRRLFIMEAVSAGSFWCKVDIGLDFDYKVRDAPFFFGRLLVVEIWMFFRTPSAAALILLISTLSMSSEANASSEMRKVIVRLMDIIDYVYPGFMEYTCLQHSSLVLITCRVFFSFSEL